MDRFLILKFDKDLLTHLPVKVADCPPAFDASIPSEALREYEFVKLTGDGFNLKLIEDFLFSTKVREPEEDFLERIEEASESFENWINGLELQTLTNELKEEIIDKYHEFR